MNLLEEVKIFLKDKGFVYSVQMRSGFDVICVTTPDGHHERVILPLEIEAGSPEEAVRQSEMATGSILLTEAYDGMYPLVITRDRWERQREMMERRLLAHLEVFFPIYARNCEVRKIDKAAAREFLERNHSYGHAACRYCYGLFFMRHTGHMAEIMEGASSDEKPGTLMAVATFSNARKWVKGDRTIRSYEWTRYASLPEVRLSGGMGRLMKAFIKEVGPDDIMSYADLEWSKGDVYRKLGFEPEGIKEPVMFALDDRWRRFPVKPGVTKATESAEGTGMRFFQNFGSMKYRLKLTDYQ